MKSQNISELKIKLWKSEMLRTFLTALILLIPKIPFSIKIILILFFDVIDCNLELNPWTPYFTKNDLNVCGTEFYHVADKVGDILSFTLVYLYYSVSSMILHT
jgi:hypothetical protein